MISLKEKKGFTLIELLIVIAIIAIIYGVVFVALDPLTRFRDSRDAKRWSAVSNVLNAIKVDQIDNGGTYISAVANATAGEVFMITDGAVTSGCDDANTNCDTNVTDDDNCVDLAGLVTEGYIGDVPISPNGAGTWSTTSTGYTLQRDSSGVITIKACESENTTEIWVAR